MNLSIMKLTFIFHPAFAEAPSVRHNEIHVKQRKPTRRFPVMKKLAIILSVVLVIAAVACCVLAGRGSRLSADVSRLEATVSEKEADIAALNDTLTQEKAAAEEKSTAYEQQLAELTAAASEKDAALAASEEQNKTLTQQSTDSAEQIKVLEQQLADDSEKISTLEQKTAALTAQLDTAAAQTAADAEKIAGLEQQVAQLTADAESKDQKAKTAAEKIAELEQQITGWADKLAEGLTAAFTSETVSEDVFQTVQEHDTLDVAYIIYTDGSFGNQYWGGAVPEGVQVQRALVTGEGEYTVGLNFTGTADGAAKGIMLGAVGVANGEKRFPGYCITITRVIVNGQDVALTPGYTTTDDGSVTRETFYTAQPAAPDAAHARTAEGTLTDAAASMVDEAAFERVETLEITFRYTAPKGE